MELTKNPVSDRRHRLRVLGDRRIACWVASRSGRHWSGWHLSRRELRQDDSKGDKDKDESKDQSRDGAGEVRICERETRYSKE